MRTTSMDAVTFFTHSRDVCARAEWRSCCSTTHSLDERNEKCCVTSFSSSVLSVVSNEGFETRRTASIHASLLDHPHRVSLIQAYDSRQKDLRMEPSGGEPEGLGTVIRTGQYNRRAGAMMTEYHCGKINVERAEHRYEVK